MDCATGSAPGRLDVLGGVADYSGALVLEMPTRQSIEVVAEADDALVVGSGRPVRGGDGAPGRARLCRCAAGPRRSAPMDALSHRRRRRPRPARDHCAPPRPPATSRRTSPNQWAWRRARRWRWPRRVRSGRGLSTRCSWPCCARRRRTSWWACRAASWTKWRWRSDLPVRCCRFSAAPRRPWPAVTLPPDLEIVGWPSGAAHDVERRALPTGPCRGLHGEAHRRSVRKAVVVLGQRASRRRPRLGSPKRSAGPKFLERWGETGDADHGGAARGDVSGAGVGTLRH